MQMKNQKKTRVAILVSDKMDFKDCYKRYNDQGINQKRRIHVPNIGAPHYILPMITEKEKSTKHNDSG